MKTAFPFPGDKVDIELIPKNDMKWEVTFSGNGKGIALTTEDLQDGEK